ncbi:transketolase family protein [Patescibacteria group bacterium]|nr:transketolase family protein [Patescibacteria group bacterium]MBU1922489.1 transketolase family protein [Patescibacteria group bacterium]
MNPRLNPKLYTKKVELAAARSGVGQGLVEAGKRDKNIVVLCADLAESTKTHLFAEKFPERFIECGVAEQNMMSLAAGLAREGKIPFVASYAVFSPGRNWDQLRTNVCYNNVPVKIVGSHAGISVGADGATHQALEDIALCRVLPNLIVLIPCDALEAKKACLAAAKVKMPVYLRLTRPKTPIITTPRSPFKIGKAQILNPGKDATVCASGPLVYDSLMVAKKLKSESISVEVINNHTIKPLDKKTIISSVKKTGCLVTVEEHQIAGGAGSAVLEMLAENFPIPAERVGMPDAFGESGEPRELLEKYGLCCSGIERAIKKVLKRK